MERKKLNKLVKGQRIDLGVLERIRNRSCLLRLLPLSNYLINAGGDDALEEIRIRRTLEPGADTSGQKHTTTQLFSIPIQGKALACSGSWQEK
jgi:hypothetical protein